MLVPHAAKTVYRLSSELANDPDQVERAQKLTLDSNRPNLGLQGEHGLFGSEEWWASVKNGEIQTQVFDGTISQIYQAGQDESDKGECDFDYVSEDGITRSASCVADNIADLSVYRVGARVRLIYAFDLLKKQPAEDGTPAFANILLELVVE